MTLTEIRTMRQTCRAKIEDLLGRTSSRELSTEETQLFNDLKAEGERLGTLEARYAVLESFDKGVTQPIIRQPIIQPRDNKAAVVAAFDHWLRTGKMAADVPLQIQQSPVDAGLASAVPTEVIGDPVALTGAVDLPSALGVREFPRDNTNPLVVPFEISPATVSKKAEAAATADSAPGGYDSATLEGDRYTSLVKVSLQSLANVAFNLPQSVTRSILIGMIAQQNADFATALIAEVTGNANCLVPIAGGDDPHTVATKLINGLDPLYGSGRFLLNQATLQTFMDARPTSGDGHPLLDVSNGTILGKPYVVANEVDNIFYGSWGLGAMRSRSPLFIQVLRELYSEKGFVGFSGYQYADWAFAAETAAAKQPIVYSTYGSGS